jgi:GDP-L-fucose synthase|tara:strand:+ start:3979 stop:4881 length:903 start_codon:yes stop_codon:yes gene_type:complete
VNKRILVTGGTGLVGKHLKDILPKADYVTSKPWNLLNSNRADDLLYIFQPDVVIHLAARVGGIMDNITYPVEYLEENTLINTNLLRACHKHDVQKVISIGSTCIYPDVVEEYPMKEKDLFNGPPPPDNFAYAMSKRLMVTQIDSYKKQYNRDWSYLVPCNLYGEHDKYEEHHSHFVSALIKKLYEAENKVEIWGTGKPLRQFMYAGDLARVIKDMIENDIVGNFNVAPDDGISIEEITKIGIEACGKGDLEIVYDKTKPDGQYRKDVDSSKLLSVLKDFEFTSLRDGISKVYEDYCERYR